MVTPRPAPTRRRTVSHCGAVVCINLRGTKARSNIELAYRTGEDRAIVAAFATIARESFLATQPAARLKYPRGVCNVCNTRAAACITGALLGH
jgi:hypothetical protein